MEQHNNENKNFDIQIKPLTPKEVLSRRGKYLLPQLVEAVNTYLCENYNGKNSVKMLRKEVVNKTIELCSKNNIHMTEQILYQKGHLDFEGVFKKYGWNVTYESPDRDESFESYYLFTPIKKAKTS